jgi:transcriptional regulator with XRE-family HTH domain
MAKSEVTGVFADILQDLLKGHSLGEVEEKTGVGVGSLSKYQNDGAEPGITALCKIAEYFGVSTDYLLGRTPVRAPDPDKVIQTIQEYTHLSEENIAYLHENRRLYCSYPPPAEGAREAKTPYGKLLRESDDYTTPAKAEAWNRILASDELRQGVALWMAYEDEITRPADPGFGTAVEQDKELRRLAADLQDCFFAFLRGFRKEMRKQIYEQNKKNVPEEVLKWLL